MRRPAIAVLAIAAVVTGHPVTGRAADAASPFDGQWEVTLSCPPLQDAEDDAEGYVQHFPAVVRDGVLRGTHGVEGQPSWHLLTGTIAPDGTAELKLEGIVKNAAWAVSRAPRGKEYTYRVRAKLEPTRGSGQRLGKRKCDFEFRRR
jgi:hypothetical protein